MDRRITNDSHQDFPYARRRTEKIHWEIARTSLSFPGHMQWHVGQKIVCINGRFPLQFHDWADHHPEEGEVYHIRKIGQARHGISGKVGRSLLLEEIVNPEHAPGKEVMFAEDRFRPFTETQSESEEAVEVRVLVEP